MNLYDRPVNTSEFMDMSMITMVINDAVARFSKGGLIDCKEYPSRWKELEPFISASPDRYHSMTVGVVEVNVGSLAGRILVTLQGYGAQVTLIGLEGEPERGCNLQSIDASTNQVIALIDTVITGWKIENLKPNKNVMIA